MTDSAKIAASFSPQGKIGQNAAICWKDFLTSREVPLKSGPPQRSNAVLPPRRDEEMILRQERRAKFLVG